MISIKSIYKIDSDYQKLKNEKSFFFKNSLYMLFFRYLQFSLRHKEFSVT